MRLFATLALTLSLAFSFITPSLGNAHQARRHHPHLQGELARRDPGRVNLYKRFDNARFTYYADGLGACGATNGPNDMIVALNAAQFDSGNYCFQMITITVGGQSVQAQITDKCPGCPFAGLDFSTGVFLAFAELSVGVLYGSWNFNSDAPSSSPPPPPPSSPPPPPPPPTTSVVIPLTTLLPPPSTTSQPPQTTTTSTSATTTSSNSNATIQSSATSLVPTQTTSNVITETNGAVPWGTTDSSIIVNVDLSIVYIGQLLSACSRL